jgi:hypothetical protein
VETIARLLLQEKGHEVPGGVWLRQRVLWEVVAGETGPLPVPMPSTEFELDSMGKHDMLELGR